MIEEECVCDILTKYISFLVDNKLVGLVATYCSLLPDEMCVETYARTLMVVEDLEERKMMLGRGLDLFPKLMEEILVLTVERIRDSDEFEDARKMKALEYLCIDPAYRLEGLVQANSLLRILLLQGKIERCACLGDGGGGATTSSAIKSNTFPTSSSSLLAAASFWWSSTSRRPASG